MLYNIKDMVSDGELVHFQPYRKGELWYKTECGVQFPVPVSDIGDGVSNTSEKVMLLMRCIRKQVASIKEEHDKMGAVTV